MRIRAQIALCGISLFLLLQAVGCKPKPATAIEPSVCQPDNNPAQGMIHTSKSGSTVLRGTLDSNQVWNYSNIRYANPMTPANRWEAPVLLEDLSTITSSDPIACPGITAGKGQEDCLIMNVWTPENPTPSTPVMVFIHGGAYMSGSGDSPLYNGSQIVEMGDVIVVDLNYRLGILGFLSLNTNNITLNGNYGIQDQQTALTWVNNNINCFGGDPNNITIFGESAGAASVLIHAVSAPGSKGLMDAAIIESNPVSIPLQELSDAQTNGASLFYEKSSCNGKGIDCLQSMELSEIQSLEKESYLNIFSLLETTPGLANALVWEPNVDGTIITSQPITQKITIPAIIGTNHDEGIPFGTIAKDCVIGGACKKENYPLILDQKNYEATLQAIFGESTTGKIVQQNSYAPCSGIYCNNVPVLSQVITDYVFTCGNRHIVENASSTVYQYQFNYASPVIGNLWGIVVPLCSGKVCHAQELPYVFQNGYRTDGSTFPISGIDKTISDDFITYWTTFAKSHSPGSSPVAWTSYSDSQNNKEVLMINDDSPSMSGSDPFQATCEFWDSIGYEMEHPSLRLVGSAGKGKK